MSKLSPAVLEGSGIGTGCSGNALCTVGGPLSASSTMSSIEGGGKEAFGDFSDGERAIITIAFSALIGSFCVCTRACVCVCVQQCV